MPESYVALLRGVNVGGRNALPMKDLVSVFEGLGCEEVKTYIQSGNVLFRAAPSRAKDLPARAAAAIRKRTALEVPVILRNGEELARIARGNPFLAGGAPPASLHVLFLAHAPTKAGAAKLDPDRSPGDTFALVGREVYLRCPNGVARTRLTNDFFDRTLGTTSTLRSWRTVLELLARVGL